MKLHAVILLSFFWGLAAPAENLIPGDSGFETGPSCLVTSSFAGTPRWSQDSSTKAEGIYSIKINFPQSDWVHSRMIPLEAGEYTLSFYAKSNKENVSMRAGICLPWTDNLSKHFTITKEWKRYSVTGKIKNGYCWIFFGSNQSSTDIWIDSVQLEKGKNITDYQPSKPLFSGIYIPEGNDRIFFTGEKIPVRLTVIDSTKKMQEANVTFTIDDSFGSTVRKEVKPVKFDNSGRWSEAIDFQPGKNGFYYMTINADSAIEKSSPFFLTAAVITPHNKNDQQPFLGLDGNGQRRPGVSRIGSVWLEIALRWNDIEKIKGSYAWGSADAIPVLKKAGYKIKAIVFGVPEWAWNEKDAEEAGKSGFNAKGHATLLPSEEGLAAFKSFTAKAAEKYNGCIDTWELGAEDDLAWGRNAFYTKKYSAYIDNGFAAGPFSEQVAQIYNNGIDGIRSVTPDAKIGLVRPSGVDCTSKNYTFTKSVLKHVNRKFDVLPLDPYCSPRYLGTGNPPSDQPEIFLQDDIERALKTTKEVAQGQPVYISELGYAVNAGEPMNNQYHLDLAARMFKSIVIARSNPEVKMFNWFVIQGGAEGGKARYNMWWEDNPAVAVPAFSTAGHLVEGTKEISELALSSSIKCYILKKENESAAVIWAVDEKGKMETAPAQNLSVTDFCGGTLSGENIFPLDRYPVIFTLKGENSFKKLSSLITKAKYYFPTLKIQLLTPDRNTAQLILKNNIPEKQDIAITASVSGKEIANLKTRVPSGNKSETTVEIPLPAEKDSFILEILTNATGNQNVEKKTYDLSFIPLKHIAKPVSIDGKLDEWEEKNLSKIFEGRAEINPPDPHIPYFGNDDLSAKIYCGWDEENLYVAAAIKDDIHANTNCGWKIWSGDCFQVAVDSMADASINKKTAYDDNDFEFGGAINAKKEAQFYAWNGGQKLFPVKKFAAVRDEKNKTTFYEMSIPWKAMDIDVKSGKVIGFNYAIMDDDDGSGVSYWYQLTPGIAGNGKNPAAFRKFYLAK